MLKYPQFLTKAINFLAPTVSTAQTSRTERQCCRVEQCGGAFDPIEQKFAQPHGLLMAARDSTGLLRWFSVKSSESSNAGHYRNSSESRLETRETHDALQHSSEFANRPGDSNEISKQSSSLYPDSSSNNVEDLSSSTSSSKSGKHIIPKEPNQPKLHFPKQKFGSKQHAFCTKWYEQFPWLHYKTFTETGFNNWQKALSKFKKHEHSTCHRFAVDKFKGC